MHDRVLFKCGQIDRPVGRFEHAIRLWSRREFFNFFPELSGRERLIAEMLGLDAVERNARQGVVVEPTSFLVKGDAIGMKFRRFASLRVDNFHAVDDNFCARFDFGGRMISQQSTGLTGFQIDDHNCSGATLRDESMSALSTRADIVFK